MVQRNHVIAIIIIILFAVLAAVSFGIWKLIHMVLPGAGPPALPPLFLPRTRKSLTMKLWRQKGEEAGGS
ncbi:hypothetical protein MY5147_004437 [Beauveria neobassiana]